MIPFANVWYTKPPIPKSKSLYDTYYNSEYNAVYDFYYGTGNDWNQGILKLINKYAVEATERRLYGDVLHEFVNDEIDNKPCHIKCHVHRLNFFERLDGFNQANHTLLCIIGEIKIIFTNDVPYNTILFKDGLYENEITLINDHYGK